MNSLFLGAASAKTVLIVVICTLVVLACAFVVVMLWWTEVKQKNKRQFLRAVGNLFKKLGDRLSPNKPVKTVYSDKARNFSGTEFLPIPAKAPTKEFTYEFVGWDKNYTDKNGNTVAKPIFIQKVNTCVVNIYDDDETTLLKSATVEFGAGVDVSDFAPTKPDSKEFVYEFVGFNKDTKNIYASQNICAVYKAIPKKFTYTFYDRDGKEIISQTTAIYGTPILVPEPPKSDVVGEEFAYWRGLEDDMILTQDESFVAVFKRGINPDAVVQEGANRQKLSSKDTLKIDIQDAKESSQKRERSGTGAIGKAPEQTAETGVAEDVSTDEIVPASDIERAAKRKTALSSEKATSNAVTSEDGRSGEAGIRDSSDDFEPLEDFGGLVEQRAGSRPRTIDIVKMYNSDVAVKESEPPRPVQKLEVSSDEENAERLTNSIAFIGQKKKK